MISRISKLFFGYTFKKNNSFVARELTIRIAKENYAYVCVNLSFNKSIAVKTGEKTLRRALHAMKMVFTSAIYSRPRSRERAVFFRRAFHRCRDDRSQ